MVEHQIVDLVVAGSTPVVHPKTNIPALRRNILFLVTGPNKKEGRTRKFSHGIIFITI